MEDEQLTFSIPTDPEELIQLLLPLPEELQRILFAATKLGVEQQGYHDLQAGLDALRSDSRTQALIHRLETTPYVELPKSKARKWR